MTWLRLRHRPDPAVEASADLTESIVSATARLSDQVHTEMERLRQTLPRVVEEINHRPGKNGNGMKGIPHGGR